MQDNDIEQEIQSKGLTAPRVTPADLQANIASEHYFTAAEGVLGAYRSHDDVHQGSTTGHESLALLTFCVLVLRNGFTVTGESACASPENFDEALGRKIAKQNAVGKIWPLMGYHLKERLASVSVATVISNNQEGWKVVAETEPNVTLDIGTKLYL